MASPDGDGTLDKPTIEELIQRERVSDLAHPFTHPTDIYHILKHMVQNGRGFERKDVFKNEWIHLLFGLTDRTQGPSYRSNKVAFSTNSDEASTPAKEYFDVLYPDAQVNTTEHFGPKLWQSFLRTEQDLYPLIKWAINDVFMKNGEKRSGGNEYFIHIVRQLEKVNRVFRLDPSTTPALRDLTLLDIILSDVTETIIESDFRSFKTDLEKLSDNLLEGTLIHLKGKSTSELKKAGKFLGYNPRGTDFIIRGAKGAIEQYLSLAEQKQNVVDQRHYFKHLQEILDEKLPVELHYLIPTLIVHNKILTGTKGFKAYGKDKVRRYENDMRRLYSYVINQIVKNEDEVWKGYAIDLTKAFDIHDNNRYISELSLDKQSDRSFKDVAFLTERAKMIKRITSIGITPPDYVHFLQHKLIRSSERMCWDLSVDYENKANQGLSEYRRKVKDFRETAELFVRMQHDFKQLLPEAQWAKLNKIYRRDLPRE